MKYFLCPLTLMLVLSSCAANNYGQELNVWLNQPRERLVSSWGEPQSVTKSPDGGESMQYVKQVVYGKPVFGGAASDTSPSNSAVADTSGFAPRVHSCIITFETAPNGTITQYHYKGDRCGRLS